MSRYTLFSVAEAAQLLSRSRFFIYDEIARGKLACHRIGGKIAISQDDLDSYVSRSRVAALGERKTKKPKETVAP
jgi:excisionase family DNA binding protein